VLCDGGFQASRELLTRYVGPQASDLVLRAAVTGTGDALRMALAVVAAAAGLGRCYGHILSRDAMRKDLWPYPVLDALCQQGVIVDRWGRPLVAGFADGIRLANILARTEDPRGWPVVVTESEWKRHGAGRSAPGEGASAYADLERLGGRVCRADGARRLAAELSLPPDSLAEAIERCPGPSAAADALVGLPIVPGSTFTTGGIAVRADGAVVTDDGSVLSGLFARGGIQGGRDRRGVCLRLAAEGCAVAVVDLDAGMAASTAQEIAAQGGVACGLDADISDEPMVAELMARAEGELGSVPQIAICNAGIQQRKKLQGCPDWCLRGRLRTLHRSDRWRRCGTRPPADRGEHIMRTESQAGSPATDRDLSGAFEDLERDGYCVIEDVLTPAEVAAVRSRLVEVAAGINPAWAEGPRNQRVYALTHKGDEFIFLLEHPVLWALMSRVLGPDFLLSSITANIAGPGGQAMMLHPDQGYIPPPWPPYPLVANIMWMLDDFTEANGATRFVPGSHRQATGGPTDQALASSAVAVTGRAGSVLCFDGRVLHQTGANTTTDVLRHGVLTYCCQPWIRQQENSSLSIPEALWPKLSEQVRQLAGLKTYAGLGMIDGPAQRGFRYGG